MNENPKRRWCQFRISTILLMMVIVGMGVGWSLDRARCRRASEQVENLNVKLHNQERLITELKTQAYVDIGQTGGPATRDLEQALKAYRKALEAKKRLDEEASQ